MSSEVSAGQLGVLQVDSSAVTGIACGLKWILYNLTNKRTVLRLIDQQEASIDLGVEV